MTKPSPSPAATHWPTSCAASSLDADEELAGTAPHARGWLVIEQPGPYGRDALTQSHFPRDVGTELASVLNPIGVRPALVRHPGAHADHSGPRRVWFTRPEDPSVQLWHTVVNDPRELLDWRFQDWLNGARLPAGWELFGERLLLVCSHAKRDVCCARLGRPLAQALHSDTRLAGRVSVWECSHLGGHRFAPTAVDLPSGWMFGRLTVDSAITVAEGLDAGVVDLRLARGNSGREPLAQAAEIAARHYLQHTQTGGVGVERSGEDWLVTIGAAEVRVRVSTESTGSMVTASCGDDPSRVTRLATFIDGELVSSRHGPRTG